MSALHVALICVSMVATAAAAQPSCWPTVKRPMDLHPVAGTSQPKVGDIVYSASSVGLAWGYTCIAPDGAWKHVVVGGTWAQYVPDWVAIADRLSGSGERDWVDAWRRYVTSTETNPQIRAQMDAIKARLPKPPAPPAAGTYVVAQTTICASADKDASGKCVRRQTYVWANGQRGAAAAERVDIGAPCDPAVGAAGFHGVLGRADRVAPCVRR